MGFLCVSRVCSLVDRSLDGQKRLVIVVGEVHSL